MAQILINLHDLSQSFGDLVHKPLLVDLTVEEGQRLKVIYGSCSGFHAVDVDSGAVYDIYLPTHVSNMHKCGPSIFPHGHLCCSRLCFVRREAFVINESMVHQQK